MTLREPPAPSTLARMYHELGKLGAPARGDPAPWHYGDPGPEELVVLAAQASRYDARLLWVLVEFVALHFDRLDPRKLRAALRESAWPGTLGVVFEFARKARPSAALDETARFVMARSAPGPGGQFFLQASAFGGELARRNAQESLSEYKRWGYSGREEPIRKELGARAVGTLDRSARMNVLRRLAVRTGALTLADYLEALEGRISRRQASRDLSSAPFLVRRGTRRGARYFLRPGRTGAPLAVGQRVGLHVTGRRVTGTVVEDLGGSGPAGRQTVRVAMKDPVARGGSFQITVPAEWLERTETGS